MKVNNLQRCADTELEDPEARLAALEYLAATREQRSLQWQIASHAVEGLHPIDTRLNVTCLTQSSEYSLFDSTLG